MGHSQNDYGGEKGYLALQPFNRGKVGIGTFNSLWNTAGSEPLAPLFEVRDKFETLDATYVYIAKFMAQDSVSEMRPRLHIRANSAGIDLHQTWNQTAAGISFTLGEDLTPALQIRVAPSGPRLLPGVDNTQDMGAAALSWKDIYAFNHVIVTSDATEKQDIAELNEAEQQVATALKGLIRKYRWISSVEKKGEDARIHVGVIAQDVAQAFEDAGLDAHRYGVFCKDIWYTREETYIHQVKNPDFDEKAEEGKDNLPMIDSEEKTRDVPCEAEDSGATEHVRYGVRYDQLWAFIISAL